MKIQIAVSGIKEKRTVLQSHRLQKKKYILRTIVWQYIEYQEQMENFLVKNIGFLMNILLLKTKTKQFKNSLVSGGVSSQLILSEIKGEE